MNYYRCLYFLLFHDRNIAALDYTKLLYVSIQEFQGVLDLRRFDHCPSSMFLHTAENINNLSIIFAKTFLYFKNKMNISMLLLLTNSVHPASTQLSEAMCRSCSLYT